MTAQVELAPFGVHPPSPFARAVLAITRRLPCNWLGLRLSMPLRRLVINRLRGRPIDTILWNARVRLYPSHNGCEKNALFTPQMFDVLELGTLATAIEDANARGEVFTFVDIGANVGLYSLFVAAHAGPRGRILAVEPQPGIVDRLRFNLRSNTDHNVVILPIAVADRDGEMELVIDERDSGGTHLNKGIKATSGAVSINVPCRPLAAILDLAGIVAIDALKIDIEGAEDLALAPFLRDAAPRLLPRLVLIEDRPASWSVDLYALLKKRGYVLASRGKQNAVFRLA